MGERILPEATREGLQHAAQALSRWLHRPVEITSDGFERVRRETALARLGDPGPAAIVGMRITGELSGQVVLTLPAEAAGQFAGALLNLTAPAELGKDPLALSCVQETATIIGSACLGSIGRRLGMVALSAAPTLTLETPAAAMQSILADAQCVGESVLVAGVDFALDGRRTHWTMWLLPSPGSLGRLEPSA